MRTREQLITTNVDQALKETITGYPTQEVADSIEYMIGFLQNDNVYDYLTSWISSHIYKDDMGVVLYYHTCLKTLILSDGNSNDVIMAFGDRVSCAIAPSEYKNMVGVVCEIKRDGKHIDIMISDLKWSSDIGKLPEISSIISKVYIQSKSPDRFAGWMYDRIKDRKHLAQSYAELYKHYSMLNMYNFIKGHHIDMRLKSDNENSLLILRDIAAVDVLSSRITSDSCTADFIYDVLALYNKPKKISKVSYALEQGDWRIYICKHINDTKCRVYTSYKV